MDAVQAIRQRFNFDIGNIFFPSSYVQAGVIVVLLFVLVLSLAQLRRHFVDWSVKGALFGLFFGFLLALVLEGFLIIGGRTVITQVLGWQNPPEPLANVLDAGRNKLIQVLGAKTKLNPTFNDAVVFFQSLNPSEAQKLKNFICKP